LPDGLPRPTWADMDVGPDGNLYLTASTVTADGTRGAVFVARSTDGGKRFSPLKLVAEVIPFNSGRFAGVNSSPAGSSEAQDEPLPCGDGPFACASGFTFAPFRTISAVSADRSGVHVVWGAATRRGQGKVFVKSSPDGIHWPTHQRSLDRVPVGHQWNPDIDSANGLIHVVFFDSRRDPAYASALPPGNTAEGHSSGPSVETFEAVSRDGGRTWRERRLSNARQQPGYETQLDNRVPWAGDYLYVSATRRAAYAVWTDARDVVPGEDSREPETDGFDVFAPCAWVPDTVALAPVIPYASPRPDDSCLSQGGLDLNIYGAHLAPKRRSG
jgi:hypothetical protein